MIPKWEQNDNGAENAGSLGMNGSRPRLCDVRWTGSPGSPTRQQLLFEVIEDASPDVGAEYWRQIPVLIYSNPAE